MKEEIPYDLISKNLAAESTPEEDSTLWDWIDRDLKNQKIFDTAVLIFGGGRAVISQHEIEGRLGKLILRRTKVLPLWWTIAACFFLVASLSALIVSLDNSVMVQTRLGQTRHVTLPDLSQVWLNGGSTIRYDEGTYFKDRRIVLEGEAYFKIEYSNTALVIEYDSVRVSLKSGELNVQAYSSDAEKIAVVADGIVTFEDLRKQEFQLTAFTDDEIVSRSDYGVVSSSINSNINFNSWMTGVYAFEDIPLQSVFALVKKGKDFNLPLLSHQQNRRRVSGVFDFDGSREKIEGFVKQLFDTGNAVENKKTINAIL